MKFLLYFVVYEECDWVFADAGLTTTADVESQSTSLSRSATAAKVALFNYYVCLL
jgi:hypothetical protein